jgi:hypothetical protein
MQFIFIFNTVYWGIFVIVFSGPDLMGAGDRGGRNQALCKSEIESTDDIETFASLKKRNAIPYFFFCMSCARLI